MKLQGNIVDVLNRRIFKGEIVIEDDKIKSIIEKNHSVENYIIPGFIDAHIHIESSMLVPSEFAKIAVQHGTVATVSDPHEIANVLGIKGVNFMIENGKQTPFKFNFGAPSCVPATTFETAGDEINSDGIRTLLQKPEIKYLAEMMNYPGVLHNDDEVSKKIAWAKHYDKPVDGHAPGLSGQDLEKYIAAGITTDHECVTYKEGLEKLQKGMKVLIREGSAAKNFEALIDLLPKHFKNMMFCSDDKHPDDLLLGHINQLCKRAVAKKIDVFKVLQVACVNPVKHYDLEVGLLQEGDFADMTIVENLKDFNVLETYINGKCVFKNSTSFVNHVPFKTLNKFNTEKKQVSDFKIPSTTSAINVIQALDGDLITKKIEANACIENENLISNPSEDILKITVVNRYNNQQPTIAFIKGFGLKKGAIASSVAHDSHNIVAVGVTDEAICKAINVIIENQGGIAVVSKNSTQVMPLPVAGIMSDQNAETVGKQYEKLDNQAKTLGSTLKAPFMTLSFMALLVIPELKISDKGLFDGVTFKFMSLKKSKI